MDSHQDKPTTHPQSFEVELDDDLDQSRPLSSNNNFNNPLPVLTRNMKPSQVKAWSYKFLVAIPIIFYILVSSLTVYQMTLTNVPLLRELDEIRNVIDNAYTTSCELKPINRIGLTTKNGACPDTMEEISIGKWGGSHSACYDKSRGHYYRGSCGDDEKIPETEETPLSFWKSKKICVNRIENSFKVKSAKDCSGKFRACRTSPSYLCVPSNQPCPITYISFKLDEHTEGTGAVLKFNETHNIVYENEVSNPNNLVELTTSLNAIPCLNLHRHPKRNSDKGSKLLKLHEHGCGTYGSENHDTVSLDSQSEYGFYTDNSLRGFEELGDFARSTKQENMLLVARFAKETDANPKCDICSEEFSGRIKTGEEELGMLTRYYRKYSRLGTVLVIAMMAALAFNVFTYIRLKDEPERMNSRLWKVNLILLGFLLGHYLTAGAFSVLSYFEISKAVVAMDYLGDHHCFNNFKINDAMIEFHRDFLQTNLKVTVEAIIVVVISLVCIVSFVVADYALNDIKTKENLQQIRRDHEHRVIVDQSREDAP